ncbi:hypothetical protein GCM10011351_15100 [Paraliobacillus quinghaiensis]|uniref:ABC transporter permease n=1 Tax=Paraliobacillus quinghaiensis TaxID=470815 RepID=A0A917WUJ3_9BACI|nr:hypothetical protein [Paraliobacillus quinghaiensis]GGM29966.1 hypothetical protein GCM10011351_15100 [Paraliobacillus quinghaiensis]
MLNFLYESYEIKKLDRLRFYLFLALLVLTYFIAIVSRVENDPVFQSYENIITFTSLVGTVLFCVYGVVLFSLNVFKREVTLSPKLFLLQATIISITSLVSFVISYTACIVIFFITENLFPIVSDDLSFSIVLNAFTVIIPLAIVVGFLNIISMGMGFLMRKSTTVSILTSILFIDAVQRALNSGWSIYIIEGILLFISSLILGLIMIHLKNKRASFF